MNEIASPFREKIGEFSQENGGFCIGINRCLGEQSSQKNSLRIWWRIFIPLFFLKGQGQIGASVISRILICLTFLLITINILMTWYADVNLCRSALDDAINNGRQMLTVFADHAHRLLDDSDSKLRAARAFYLRSDRGAEVREFLAETRVRHNDSPVVAFTFFDREGQFLFDSEKREGANVSATGLDYFDYFQSHDDDTPYIDATRFGRVWQKYLFRIVRRLSRDGQFGGVAILNLRPKVFTDFSRQFDLGTNAVYVMLTLEHKLIARQPLPPPEAYNVRQDDLELWKHTAIAQAGMFRGVSPFDGVKRVYLYKTLPDYPLVVEVGIAEDDVIEKLSGIRTNNFLHAGVFSIISIVFCVLLLILLRKNAAIEQSNISIVGLGDELRVLAQAFQSSQGMVISDTDCNILRVNQAFAEITGYPAGEVVGRKTNLLKSGRHDANFYSAMWEKIKRDGMWSGEIWNRHKDGRIYPEWLTITAAKGDSGDIRYYIGAFHDISQQKETENRIKELAFYDPLTGLPNRRLLMDRLSQALAANARKKSCGGVLFFDLDNFKTLNDTHGHAMGDLLLQQVAERLKECVRDADTLARLGGDEFVVMLEDLSEDRREAATQVEIVGQKILSTINKPYDLPTNSYLGSASIGATLFDEDQESADEILKKADIAMYQAKAAGRNSFRFFDPNLQAAVKARAAMEADLRHGLRENQFLLYYQPQVDGGGNLTGAEALVRWRHPERGMVSPADFITLAEETGLILFLGQWVLQTGCAQLAAWADQPDMAHLSLAINVSARQFRQEDFVDQVLTTVTRTGANPQKLKLELTESMLFENVSDVVAKMNALKACGITFSLDDFGTGYSSLSYLKRLPLDQLKIDQSFVRDMLADANYGAIAQTIIALGQNLDLMVIAEGVETMEQRDFLATQGCHAYQGYLFGRPVPVEEFENFLRQK